MANESKEFKALEMFFKIAKLPESIQLDQGIFIPDVRRFVEMNLNCLRTGEMNEVAAAGRYYRMQQLMNLVNRKRKLAELAEKETL